MVNDSASGGIGKEGLSIVDSEAGAKQVRPSGLHGGSVCQYRQTRSRERRARAGTEELGLEAEQLQYQQPLSAML